MRILLAGLVARRRHRRRAGCRDHLRRLCQLHRHEHRRCVHLRLARRDGTPTFTAYNDTPGCAGLISNVICTSNGGLPGAFKSTSGAHQSGTVRSRATRWSSTPGRAPGRARRCCSPRRPPATICCRSRRSSPTTTRRASSSRRSRRPARCADRDAERGEPDLLVQRSAADLRGRRHGRLRGQLRRRRTTTTSTGINVTLTTVPEPATWGLLVVGFGLVGFAARRRRIALAA